MKKIVILMGVTGSGKTTVGTLLAARLQVAFADADDFHPLANKQKMAAGIPLTDEDRQPWLEELNRVLLGWSQSDAGGVLACSALKEGYRRTLTHGLLKEAVMFCLLEGPEELIAQRLVARKHEYMNPKLLESQLATLEPPVDAPRVANDATPQDAVNQILSRMESV